MPKSALQSDPQLVLRNVPACLCERAQWVCWKYVIRRGKVTKVPINPCTEKPADTTDPATWGTFEQALAACRCSNDLAGVGFVFSADDPFTGVDVDNCLDAATGELKPWARPILDQLDSYSEISPSGKGVKVFVRASKSGSRCKIGYEDGAIEMYDHDRFFTVTGVRLTDCPADLEKRQSAIDALYASLFAKRQTPWLQQVNPSNNGHALDDDEVVRLAFAGRKSGAKFAALWGGEWSQHFASQSEADSSVTFTLAFYTKDAAQIDRLFRRSGLMREKWDEKHGQKTYGQMTIDKALETVASEYRPRRPTQRSAVVSNASDGVPRDAEGTIALGQRDPETGRLVLAPKKTLPTAKAFIEQFHFHQATRTLHSYAGTILVWRGNRYVEIEEESVRQQLQPWLHDALRYQYNRQTESMELVDFESNPATIKAAIESIRAYAHLPANITPTVWLSDAKGQPDPHELLPCATGSLHIPSGRMLPSTPALFNMNALDFDYDANAEPPEQWLKFHEQLWGDDVESVFLLQEWMGYCLVADTSQQKMLMLVGPRRSGKGTIGRILHRLVGAGNVVGPTMSGLAGNFGLQPLIGKSLAIVSDARFTGENIGVVVERLLCISGEDRLTVDRKFLGSVTMKLPTRFTFLTNELPRLKDASGALAGRFLILRLTHSFYGKEDVTLTAKLMAELPGILLWAIEGLKRLRPRGHFVQPESVLDAVRELEDLSSPVLAFVRDRCVVAPGRRIWVDNLYAAWNAWCEQDGRSSVTNKQTFGRDLAAAVPGITRRRGSGDVPFYEGIDLKGGMP